MKLRLLLFFLLATYTFAQAQKKKNIYYLKENGKEVPTRAEADFIRIIEEPDSGDNRFQLLELYKNGKRKSQGYISAFEPRLIFEGPVMSFDSTGKRTQVMNYLNGTLSGVSIFYHKNGKERRRAEYVKAKPVSDQMIGMNSSLTDFIFNTNAKIIYDADSNGKVNIADGNGHLVEISKSGDGALTEEGDYVNGFKHGNWSGKYSNKSDTFTELYENGELKSGESIKDGNTYPYIATMEAPSYPGGQQAWNKYLGSSTKYPAEAYKNGIRGRVFLNFVIDQKGNLTEIKIDKPVDRLLDQEAIRVLSSAPRWKPAKQRGIPVRVRYNQSINFNF
ncbi:TonB family protein [Pedobacter sp. G11]|uniref:energy transducer TonB n=1 Tax=Pedobacter sp. G11 TaxID=2482728 RepID=UPI000F5E7B7F|nr:energy transducer TonB [Pedobacter sp. G11]AZI25002.1 TonB family protein [Pedobacter sp. G11]